MNKTQQDIINRITDDCGTIRATVDGMRQVNAALKLEVEGYGRFEPAGYWDRSGNSRVATYVTGGYFYPAN